MIIKELQLKDYPYKTRRGLSERIAKNYFEKQNFEVFRGMMILGKEHSFYYNEYENVKAKYDRLEAILHKKLKLKLWVLRKMLKEIKGIPDYFIHKNNDSFFAEIKLEHEQIKPHQLKCIELLEDFKFNVMLLRIKSKPYRIKQEIDLKQQDAMKIKNRNVAVKQKRFKVNGICH